MKKIFFLLLLLIIIRNTYSSEKTLYQRSHPITGKNVTASKTELESFLHFSYPITMSALVMIVVFAGVSQTDSSKNKNCAITAICGGLALFDTIQSQAKISRILAEGPTAQDPNNAKSTRLLYH